MARAFLHSLLHVGDGGFPHAAVASTHRHIHPRLHALGQAHAPARAYVVVGAEAHGVARVQDELGARVQARFGWVRKLTFRWAGTSVSGCSKFVQN